MFSHYNNVSKSTKIKDKIVVFHGFLLALFMKIATYMLDPDYALTQLHHKDQFSSPCQTRTLTSPNNYNTIGVKLSVRVRWIVLPSFGIGCPKQTWQIWGCECPTSGTEEKSGPSVGTGSVLIQGPTQRKLQTYFSQDLELKNDSSYNTWKWLTTISIFKSCGFWKNIQMFACLKTIYACNSPWSTSSLPHEECHKLCQQMV